MWVYNHISIFDHRYVDIRQFITQLWICTNPVLISRCGLRTSRALYDPVLGIHDYGLLHTKKYSDHDHVNLAFSTLTRDKPTHKWMLFIHKINVARYQWIVFVAVCTKHKYDSGYLDNSEMESTKPLDHHTTQLNRLVAPHCGSMGIRCRF